VLRRRRGYVFAYVSRSRFPGVRVKPYLTQIVSTILWRLNNKSAKVRQQAADLTSKLAVVIKQCEEDSLLSKLGVVLFEQLGEEYPDTLGRSALLSRLFRRFSRIDPPFFSLVSLPLSPPSPTSSE
jgi:hypothetical protein